MVEIQFRKYTAKDASTFKTLNVEWLEMYFEVEPIDERVLSNIVRYFFGISFGCVDSSSNGSSSQG